MQRIKRDARMRAAAVPDFVSILIVDDERFDRARIRRICDNLDFDSLISEAETLQSLGTALENDKFDLIFLDFNMPDGDGLLALDAIHLNEKNSNAAVIMVTGDDDVDVAITAMTNGCSDFVKKENVSQETIRRATMNALQKSILNKKLENESVLRANVETVLNHFTKQCVEEFQPMLYNVMRHVRALQSARQDEHKYSETVHRLEKSCERLFDFVCDIEDSERKKEVLLQVDGLGISGAEAEQGVRPKSHKASLFGRRPH